MNEQEWETKLREEFEYSLDEMKKAIKGRKIEQDQSDGHDLAFVTFNTVNFRSQVSVLMDFKDFMNRTELIKLLGGERLVTFQESNERSRQEKLKRDIKKRLGMGV